MVAIASTDHEAAVPIPKAVRETARQRRSDRFDPESTVENARKSLAESPVAQYDSPVMDGIRRGDRVADRAGLENQ